MNGTANIIDENFSSLYSSLNFTNESTHLDDVKPETYVVPIVFSLIFVIGVLGNGTLIIIFLRHRTMRNVPNTYIFSLALADLLVIITSVPFTSLIYTVASWPFGELICKMAETSKDISIGVSVFTLTALSGDRFFAICDPLKKFHTGNDGRKATRITICVAVSIWLLAILFSVPTALATHIKYIQDENNITIFSTCYPFREDWMNQYYPKFIVMTRFLVLYIIPLAIIAVFYICMAVYLFKSTRNVPGEMQGMHRQIRARKKVAVTVLVFVIMFAVCFLPFHTFLLFFYFNPNAQEDYNDFWHYLKMSSYCFSYLNSCANPVALYFVSGAFRKHFKRYLLCIKPKRSRCNTCQGQHTTQMSMMSTTRRNQSQCSKRSRNTNGNRRQLDPVNTQETSVSLLGNGNDHICSKI